MNFADRLKKIVDKIGDVLGAAISGVDGIILEEYKVDPALDLASLAAEYGALWRAVDNAGLSVDLGAAKEITVLTGKMMIILKKINSEYFLVLAIGSERNFGKGRFFLKREAGALLKEL